MQHQTQHHNARAAQYQGFFELLQIATRFNFGGVCQMQRHTDNQQKKWKNKIGGMTAVPRCVFQPGINMIPISGIID